MFFLIIGLLVTLNRSLMRHRAKVPRMLLRQLLKGNAKTTTASMRYYVVFGVFSLLSFVRFPVNLTRATSLNIIEIGLNFFTIHRTILLWKIFRMRLDQFTISFID